MYEKKNTFLAKHHNMSEQKQQHLVVQPQTTQNKRIVYLHSSKAPFKKTSGDKYHAALAQQYDVQLSRLNTQCGYIIGVMLVTSGFWYEKRHKHNKWVLFIYVHIYHI